MKNKIKKIKTTIKLKLKDGGYVEFPATKCVRVKHSHKGKYTKR